MEGLPEFLVSGYRAGNTPVRGFTDGMVGAGRECGMRAGVKKA
jgi:hypothetical protein